MKDETVYAFEGRPTKTMIVKVAGVTYDGRQAAVAKVTLGELVQLRREPENPYDYNAIRVERQDQLTLDPE